MPKIPNFPPKLLEEHGYWHHKGRAIQAGEPGSGDEFLIWHRRYINQFMFWLKVSPDSASLDEAIVRGCMAWRRIPDVLKNPDWGWDDYSEAEQHLQNMSNFETHDDLGRFIEGGLHDNFLHNAAAEAFKEPDINDANKAPESTYFWQIHGLINGWSKAWLNNQEWLGN